MAGIYNNALGFQGNSTANAECSLGTMTVGGGGVSDGNAVILHAEVTSSGDFGVTASFNPKLNGQPLLANPMDVSGTRVVFDLITRRTGTTTGEVTGTFRRVDLPGEVFDLGIRSLSGLSWSSNQSLDMRGTSNQQSGVQLQFAGEAH